MKSLVNKFIRRDSMNLNELAKRITLKEGLKESLSIAQVKEVIKLFQAELSKMSAKDLNRLIKNKNIKVIESEIL
jgi:hypothetical protein